MLPRTEHVDELQIHHLGLVFLCKGEEVGRFHARPSGKVIFERTYLCVKAAIGMLTCPRAPHVSVSPTGDWIDDLSSVLGYLSTVPAERFLGWPWPTECFRRRCGLENGEADDFR